jgi:SAM-dependent methyltransferase
VAVGTERDVAWLLAPNEDPKVPTLGNLIAGHSRIAPDSLGARHGYQRDSTILGWLENALRARSGPRRLLDLGCAYGNHIFMTNARLGYDQEISYIGVELAENRVAYATAVAAAVPGHGNCRFETTDIEQPLTFADDEFDAVTVADVIEHLTDPEAFLRELRRVTRPGGTIVVSTPQRQTVFKSLARRVDRLTRGRLYHGYYAGKDADVDEHGHAVMEVDAGHEHISEQNLDELSAVGRRAGLTVGDVELMNVMSGSSWFDRHPVVLSAVLVVEAVQQRLQVRSWAHAMVVRFVV